MLLKDCFGLFFPVTEAQPGPSAAGPCYQQWKKTAKVTWGGGVQARTIAISWSIASSPRYCDSGADCHSARGRVQGGQRAEMGWEREGSWNMPVSCE